jgi:hypothetical protein
MNELGTVVFVLSLVIALCALSVRGHLRISLYQLGVAWKRIVGKR